MAEAARLFASLVAVPRLALRVGGRKFALMGRSRRGASFAVDRPASLDSRRARDISACCARTARATLFVLTSAVATFVSHAAATEFVPAKADTFAATAPGRGFAFMGGARTTVNRAAGRGFALTDVGVTLAPTAGGLQFASTANAGVPVLGARATIDLCAVTASFADKVLVPALTGATDAVRTTDADRTAPFAVLRGSACTGHGMRSASSASAPASARMESTSRIVSRVWAVGCARTADAARFAFCVGLPEPGNARQKCDYVIRALHRSCLANAERRVRSWIRLRLSRFCCCAFHNEEPRSEVKTFSEAMDAKTPTNGSLSASPMEIPRVSHAEFLAGARRMMRARVNPADFQVPIALRSPSGRRTL